MRNSISIVSAALLSVSAFAMSASAQDNEEILPGSEPVEQNDNIVGEELVEDDADAVVDDGAVNESDAETVDGDAADANPTAAESTGDEESIVPGNTAE